METNDVDRVFGGPWTTRAFFSTDHEAVDVGTCRICGASVVGTWRQEEMGRHVAWHVKHGDELPEGEEL